MTLKARAERASLGLNITASATSSLAFNVTGYTTKHEELLIALLDNFTNLSVSEVDFNNALDSYKKAIENIKKAMPNQQAFVQVHRLNTLTPWSEAEILMAANKVTLKDLVEFHKAVMADPFIRIYAFGNYTPELIKHIALLATQKLPSKRTLKIAFKTTNCIDSATDSLSAK